MTNEKAIEVIKYLKWEEKYPHRGLADYDDFNEKLENAMSVCGWATKALDVALEAIRKRIPKKPKYVGEIPVCSCGMNLSKEEYPYCRHCGQAIDWSDTQ